MSELAKRFGKLLQNVRKRRKLTQADLAEAAGVSFDLVAKLETGATAPSFKSIDLLARALNVDPAEFFTADLPGGALDRQALNAITTRISGLPDDDLHWLAGIIDAALASRR